MKKAGAILLTIALCVTMVSFAGCGEETKPSDVTTTTESSGETTTTQEQSAANDETTTTVGENDLTTTGVAEDVTTTAKGTTTTAKKTTTTVKSTTTTVSKTSTTVNSTTTTTKPTTTTATTTTKATTTTTTKVTTTKATTTTTAHSHSYVSASCTEPAKCACGATQGDALGHNYKYFVCTRCKVAQTEGSFVNLKDYCWKYGEEEVNIDVPGKEDWPPYTLSLDIFDFQRNYCDSRGCFSYEKPTVISDIHAFYDSPFPGFYTTTYNNKLYQMSANDCYEFTYVENGDTITVTFTAPFGGVIVLQKKGFNQLVVLSNTDSRLNTFLTAGATLTAYPRWELQ